MYNFGLQPQLANLYPPVEFPVSRSTPMISSSIKWKHLENWYVASFATEKQITSREIVMEINIREEDYEYMSGHIIDGRNLLPATAYIELIWKMVGKLREESYKNIPVVFENVKFLRATLLSNQAAVKLTLMVQKSTGRFEITENGNAIVTGTVRVPLDLDKENVPIDYLEEDDNEKEIMKTRDIYKELKLRGYQYTDLFRSLRSASITASRGHIEWMNNWVVFMDNMLQIRILGTDTRSPRVLTEIEKLVINPRLHAQYLKDTTTENTGRLTMKHKCRQISR
ncbi:fatty acid synthase-like [Harpegnathos saltator]|uniref:fatty acid synthase-like n=1 Tax=Harpegnathos saltator TaxID=610380 RepID=UPI000DBED26C|nr:fatty acid synthase-like [Harpegnathos saltator]